MKILKPTVGSSSGSSSKVIFILSSGVIVTSGFAGGAAGSPQSGSAPSDASDPSIFSPVI